MDENLLQPIQESEVDEDQQMFNLSPPKQASWEYENALEQKLKLAQLASIHMNKYEAQVWAQDINKLKQEIVNLVRETKTLFKVLDNVLPRKQHDAISSLLEFNEKYEYTNVEEEIDDFLSEDEQDEPMSLRKSLKEIKTIKQNIVTLRGAFIEIV